MYVPFIWKENAEEELNAPSIIQQTANTVTSAQIRNALVDIQVNAESNKSPIQATLDVRTQGRDHQEKHYQPAPQDHEEGSKRKQPQNHQGKVHQMTKRKRKAQEIDPHLQVEERKKKGERNHPKAQLTW